MLSGISGGRYISVTVGGTAYINKNYNGNQFMTGDMRYDIDSQTIKVFDGQSWQSLYGGTATVNLTDDAKVLLDWVNDKRAEEQRIQELAARHPAVADALDALKKAEEQVRIVAALVQE